MVEQNKRFTFYVLIACAVCSILGFYAGRKTILVDNKIKYVKGETVFDTIRFPVIKKEIKHDTILLVEHDTIQTLIDWNSTRFYTEKLFDDKKGRLDIEAEIQFNRLQRFSYKFTPIYKEIISYRTKTWQPVLGLSYNSFNILNVSGGLFYYDLGFELQYLTDFDKNGWGIGIKYKF